MELSAFLRKYDNGAGWFNLANNRTISRQEVEAAGGMDDLIRDMAALSREDMTQVLSMFERYSITGGAIRQEDRQRAASALTQGLQPPRGGSAPRPSAPAPAQAQPWTSTDLIDLEALTDAVELYRQTGQLPPGLEGTSFAGRRPAPPEGWVISQLDDRYENAPLGRSRSSIKSKGCLLASMTMAANRLNGTSYDLIRSNSIITRSGGFSGAALITPKAAAALDTTIDWRRAVGRGTVEQAAAQLDRGKLVIAGVDYKPGQRSSAVSEADHFVLIVGRDGDKLLAVDPAGGREIALARQRDGSYRWGRYVVTEVMVLSQAQAGRH